MSPREAAAHARRFPESPVFYRDLERTYRTAVRASGAWIEAADGGRWLDACGGALTISVGHGRPEVVQAAARQLEDAAYVHGAQFTTEAMEEAAAALVTALPPGFRDAKVYLTPGGTEAVETAMKLARAHALASGHPERVRIVSQHPGYHGNTLGALAVSGRDALREPYLPLLADMPLVPAPWCPRCPLGLRYPECEVACAAEVDRALDDAGGDVAAVLVEPVLGASAGGFAPPEDYLRAVRRVTRERGLLLIADEVLSGCGRTGRFLASEYAAVEPDILVLGKGLTSGFVPGGAVVAKADVVAAVAPDFRHGFTFSHHPVVAAVVREVLRLIREEGLVERASSLEPSFRAALDPLSTLDAVHGWWVRGLLAGIAFDAPGDGGMSAREVAARTWQQGLLVYPVRGPAGQGDVVLLAPPLTVSSDELAEIGRRLLAALT